MLPAEALRAPRTAAVAARALILAGTLAVVVAGCGDDDGDGGGADGADGTELTVTLDPDGPGGEQAGTETAACDPGAGDSPCSRLKATDFAALDPATPCTQIYGGPDEATVEGTVAGEEVTATLTRANGCEIDRFDLLTPLLRELFPGYEPGASLQP